LASDPQQIDLAGEATRRALRDANRVSGVINRLRALFARNATETESLDLNDLVREVVELARHDLRRERVVLRLELTDGPCVVNGDRVQLEQVILNLLRNAVDSMRQIDDRPRDLRIVTERNGSNELFVSVRDSGVGFGSQDISRLFDAFFTTKKSGMGIGLSVSRSIIESHQGRLWAVNNEGPGATFSFSIPYCPDIRSTICGASR
jgi:signal transduction histidine kinase